jgi:hypothetical protein
VGRSKNKNDDPLRNRVGAPHERTEVTILAGETIWQLAEVKYDGKHPIHAIFEVNNLEPGVTERDGIKELQEPIYHAGATYIFPSIDEIPALESKFRQKLVVLGLDQAGTTERLGKPSESRSVCLRPDETFWRLSTEKYGKPQIEAIFEANGLMQKVVERDGKQELHDPIYYAGKSYIFPAESEIEDLKMRYQRRLQSILQDAKNN